MRTQRELKYSWLFSFLVVTFGSAWAGARHPDYCHQKAETASVEYVREVSKIDPLDYYRVEMSGSPSIYQFDVYYGKFDDLSLTDKITVVVKTTPVEKPRDCTIDLVTGTAPARVQTVPYFILPPPAACNRMPQCSGVLSSASSPRGCALRAQGSLGNKEQLNFPKACIEEDDAKTSFWCHGCR